MDSERLFKFVHDLNSKIGIVEANLVLLGEGLPPRDAAGALSDSLEASRALRDLVADMNRLEESEITQEYCVHSRRVERAPKAQSCECCRNGVTGTKKRCAICA